MKYQADTSMLCCFRLKEPCFLDPNFFFTPVLHFNVKVKESRFPLRVRNCWRQRIWYPALFRGVSDIQQVIEAASWEHEFIKANVTVFGATHRARLFFAVAPPCVHSLSSCKRALCRKRCSMVAWGSRIHFKESIPSDGSFQIKLFKKNRTVPRNVTFVLKSSCLLRSVWMF